MSKYEYASNEHEKKIYDFGFAEGKVAEFERIRQKLISLNLECLVNKIREAYDE